MAAVRMTDNSNNHIPVLLNEAVEHMITLGDGVYVDATFGRGSHSRAILQQLNANARLIAFDKDPAAIAYANAHIHDPRFTIVHSSYANIALQLQALGVYGQVQGILFDLGVSSPQLDNPERGFSFMRDGALDMRMDTTQGVTASEWLQTVEEAELAGALWKYGEEKYARRITKAIVEARQVAPIATTLQLAELITNAVPKRHYHEKHPATRSFQAIRIAVNHELSELEAGLSSSLEALATGGRLAVISFHSLEDRIVKQFIRANEKGQDLPRGLPVKGSNFNARIQAVGKAIKPSLQEVNTNPRARSAILRIAEKRL